MKDTPHVIIVGSGIIGASIAYHLSRAGARVTIIDAQEPGGIATRHSWAWINATWGNPEPYFRLRLRAMSEWRRLEAEVPAIAVAWVGSLFWQVPAEELETFVRQHAAWGYDLRPVSRVEIQRLEPHLATPPELAVHAPMEGVVEPLVTAQALLAAAQQLGSVVMPQNPVRALTRNGDRVTGVEAKLGRLTADEVVVAGGVGTAALLATVGVSLPLVFSPGLLVATQPHPKTLNGLLISPQMELRQMDDGRFLAVGSMDGIDPDGDIGEPATAIVDTIMSMIDSGSSLVPDFHAVASRPMSRDGFPAVGRSDGLSGLYTALTHSGITLAPAIGRFVAEELLTGERNDLLRPYAPDRFS